MFAGSLVRSVMSFFFKYSSLKFSYTYKKMWMFSSGRRSRTTNRAHKLNLKSKVTIIKINGKLNNHDHRTMITGWQIEQP